MLALWSLRDVEDLADQSFQAILTQRLEELVEQPLLAWHGLGTDDVRLGDRGSILLQPHLLIGPLATQPEGEGGDLGAAEVDVDAVQVVRRIRPGTARRRSSFVG